MKVNFTNVEDSKDFDPIPAGRYLCQVEKVEESITSRGDPLWRQTFVVSEGEHSGRRVFDNLVLSQAALPRAKFVLTTLGLDLSQEIDLTPQLLIGRACVLTVEVTDYQAKDGTIRRANLVPYHGYEKAEKSPF